jgi:K+-sensing histidine kinase KdpD
MHQFKNPVQIFKNLGSSIIHLVLIASLPVIFVAWGIITPSMLEISSFYGASALLLISLSFVYTVFLGKQIYLTLIHLNSSSLEPLYCFKEMHEISASLTEQREMKQRLMNFIRQTVALIGAEDGIYLPVDEAKDSNRLPFPHAKELPILIGDIFTDSRYEHKESVRSYLSIPIVSLTGDVHGNLIYVHSKANHFSSNHLEMISALAIQVAIVIENIRLTSEAAQAIELRDTFLSVASHELKTPLTSIYLQFESLKRKVIQTAGTDEKVIDLFSRFQFQLGRLTRLVNELLDVTQIASGKMSLHLEEVSLEKIISYVCANFEIESIQKGSPITFEVKNTVSGNWDSNRLGLFICKEIILHQGGDIQVESQIGEGSTFTMRLPLS